MKDLRVQRSVLADAAEDEIIWRVIQPAYDAVSIYDGPAVLDSQLASLTPGQRALLSIYWTDAEVSNGGFDQYFFNSTGDLAYEAIAGFKRIGAARTAQLLERVLASFPGGPPSRDRDARAEILDEIDEDKRDELFEVLDQEFYDLLEAEVYVRANLYVREHPAEFFQD
jgi:hypothetical protein